MGKVIIYPVCYIVPEGKILDTSEWDGRLRGREDSCEKGSFRVKFGARVGIR